MGDLKMIRELSKQYLRRRISETKYKVELIREILALGENSLTVFAQSIITEPEGEDG